MTISRSPTTIAFVRENNIYLWENGKITAITKDGGPNLFHGVPDWVYEEEVTEDRFTLWFSPDGQYLAYLSFDESGVRTYTVPYYMNNQKYPSIYPRELKIRYPKAGSTNPRVKASVVKVSQLDDIRAVPVGTAFPPDNLIIGEFAWLTEGHGALVLRCFNRVQNRDKHLLYDVESRTAKIIRERDGTDGWLDNHRTIKYIGKLSGASGIMSGNNSYYLDLSDEDGWSHIYLHSITGGKPKQLTSGKWEVRHIVAVDKSRSLVYFTSTEHHPTESHPYTLSLRTGLKKPLVDDTQAGYWDMQLSSKAGFYTLNYQGPNAPFQELYAFNNTKEPIRIITDNADFVTQLSHYTIPATSFRDLAHPSGFNLSSMLRLPVNFNASKKYPVLLTPYGGPGSQEVTKRMHLADWKTYISSDPQLEYITYTVDNRGTGWRGRKFRSIFAKAMGTIDAEDQIWAARELAKAYPWVDAQKIGIWGWSNGGYLTGKVVEHNSDVISFAMITAPTSDCRLYDSMYTERYMGMPEENRAAFDRAAIRNATGFKNIPGGVVIQHGTGDDNVHFQHTAALVDLLMGAGVGPDKLTTQFFTDSDHSIHYNKAQDFLYAQLTKKLLEEKKRVPGAPKANHQWLDQGEAKRYNSKFGQEGVGDGFTSQWNMLAESGYRSKQSPGGRDQFWGL